MAHPLGVREERERRMEIKMDAHVHSFPMPLQRHSMSTTALDGRTIDRTRRSDPLKIQWETSLLGSADLASS